MKFTNIFLIAFSIVLLSSCAASKKVKTADQLYKEGSFYNAVDEYQEAYAKKENNTKITFQIAETNRQLKDYKQAEKWYAKTIEIKETAKPEAKFYLAQMQKAQGQYDKSIESFQDFLDSAGDGGKDDSAASMMSALKKRAKMEIEGAELAQTMMEAKPESKVELIDNGLNNTLQDLSPKVIDENQVLMAALLPKEAINLEEAHDANEDYYTKLYYATKSNGSWEREMLPDNINSANSHVGNGVVSKDGNTLYFTKCDENPAQVMTCNIYKSEKDGNAWGDPEAISRLNKKEASTTQPALGVDADGNEVLYFASNRTGGKGGFDIYYSTMDDDNDFSSPQNLRAINTKWDDLTPFYDQANETLYFSSEGHPGMGGLDVFKVAGNIGTWEEAITNAGTPINSSADDLYLALNESGKKGFMVSNRDGATSTRGNNCCDDVFKVQLVRDVFISIMAEDSMGKEVTDVAVSLYSAADGDFEFIADGMTKEGKMLDFLTEEGMGYKVTGDKEGYWPSITTVNAMEFEELEGDTLIAKLIMRPIERVQINNVFFAFDKSDIREQYQPRMDSIIELMEEHGELIVRIEGHTDSKGSDEYNDKLSEKRAAEAKAYFLEIGIPEDRILTKAMGEGSPIADNENEDGSDNPEGRAKNRRVEFKLLNDVNEDLDIEIEYGNNGPYIVE